jgi:insulysin
MWNNLLLCACFILCGALPCKGNEYRVLEDRSSGYEDGTQALKIVLQNGMKVLLLSNEGFIESSVALGVEAGSWDDPVDHPGMAHFVEHLLFLGTEAYPEESEYKRYIQERGGKSNASTFRGKSVYGFSIDTSYLEGALERFAHFFIDPLFTKSAIQREVHAVHHEFEDSLENEFSRIWRVFKETGNPKHPNANFSFGNLESLKMVEREDVVSWFNKWYLADRMKLVVMSPLSLQEMADLTSSLFSKVTKGEQDEKKRPHQDDLSSPFQQGHFIHIDSVFNSRILSLLWEIPKSYMTAEKTQVLSLIQSVLSQNYPNSLSTALEKEGLGQGVKVEFWRVEKENGIFRIDVALTQQGVRDYRKVIERCFQSLAFLKGSAIPQDVFEKVSLKKSRMLFSSGYHGAMRLAIDLIDNPIEEYPDEKLMSFEAVQEMIPLLIETFSSTSCTYFLVAPSKESGVEPSQLEKWMGTKYLVRRVPPEEIVDWSRSSTHPTITLWEKGLFLEEIPPIEILPVEDHEEKAPSVLNPVFIVDDEKARIRLMEASLKGNRAEVFFCIATPFLESSVEGACFNELLALTIQNKSKEAFSELNGVEWKISIDAGRLCIYLKSPKDSLNEHINLLFSFIRNQSLSLDEFTEVKGNYLDKYRGDPEPLAYAQQVLDSVTSAFYFTEMELYQGMSKLTYEEYDVFQQVGFNAAFIEGSFLGEVSKEEVAALVEEIYERFYFEPYEPQKVGNTVPFFWDEPRVFSQKTHRKGSSLLLLVASKEKERISLPEHQIIAGILQNEFFKELRTRQQTAYRLYNWSERVEGHLCHGFALQSSTHHPEDLLNRVNEFLDDFSDNAEGILSEERVELIRNSLIIRCENQKKQKEGDSKVLEWNIRALKKVSRDKVIHIAKEMFCLENGKRVAVLIEGQGAVL